MTKRRPRVSTIGGVIGTHLAGPPAGLIHLSELSFVGCHRFVVHFHNNNRFMNHYLTLV